MKRDSTLSLSLSLSLGNASILNKIKEGYLIWMAIVPHIPKSSRYTLGARIENKFLDLLELTYASYFSEKEKKAEKISECIFASDILKFLISTAWDGKFIANKQYEDIAVRMDEIGKMLWGWRKSLDTHNKQGYSSSKKNPA